MKLSILFVLLMGGFSHLSTAQTPAESIASKIADKMKDSLSLTQAVRDQIYTINMNLHAQKMNSRAVYLDPSDLRPQLQKIENTRDSLYRTVLSAEKFQLYQQKKRSLVNNN
jgi:hypothetical protein